MELMDTSLDKFYKQVIEKGLTIPEDILGKIAVSVGVALGSSVSPSAGGASTMFLLPLFTDRQSSGAPAQQPAGHPPR